MKLILQKTIFISLATLIITGCGSSTKSPPPEASTPPPIENTSDTRDNNISFGDTSSKIKNSSFATISKYQNDTISNIWDISFKIDNKDINNFNIGIQIKVPSGSIGEIVYQNISIENGTITSYPKIIWIKGIKSTGTQTNSSENLEELKAIIDSSISLDNNSIFTLNINTIAQNRTLISEDSFRRVGDYNITIVSDKLDILGVEVSKFNYGTMIKNDFKNSEVLIGILNIK